MVDLALSLYPLRAAEFRLILPVGWMRTDIEDNCVHLSIYRAAIKINSGSTYRTCFIALFQMPLRFCCFVLTRQLVDVNHFTGSREVNTV